MEAANKTHAHTHALRLTHTHMVTVDIRLLPHHQDHCPDLPAFAITDYTINVCGSASGCVCLCVSAISCWPARCDISSSGTLVLHLLPTLQNHLTLSNNSNVLQSANIVITDKRPSIPIENLHIFIRCINSLYCCPIEIIALCCSMCWVWPWHWWYPGYLNTQSVHVPIVNQIMRPQLRYCVVMSVT